MNEGRSAREERERNWRTWMIAAQAGDRAAFERLLLELLPVARQNLGSGAVDPLQPPQQRARGERAAERAEREPRDAAEQREPGRIAPRRVRAHAMADAEQPLRRDREQAQVRRRADDRGERGDRPHGAQLRGELANPLFGARPGHGFQSPSRSRSAR